MSGKKLLPLSGIAAVALILGSFAIAGETPDTDAPIDEVVTFYTDHDSDTMASALMLGYAAVFFMLFTTAIAGAVRRAQGDSGGASALGFGGGILFSVGLLLFAGINFALGDVPEKLDPSAVQTLHILNEDLFLPAAMGLVIFNLGIGAGVLKTGILPAWLGWVAIVIAVVGLTPAGFFALPLFGLWIIIAGVMLSMRAGSPETA